LDFKNTQVLLSGDGQFREFIIKEDQLYIIESNEAGQQINFISW
jgi:hypothetical protein